MVKGFFKEFKERVKSLDKSIHYVCDCSLVVRFSDYDYDKMHKFNKSFTDINQIDIIKEISDCYYDDYDEQASEVPDNRMDDISIGLHFYNDNGDSMDFDIQVFWWVVVDDDCDYVIMQLFRVNHKEVNGEIVLNLDLIGEDAISVFILVDEERDKITNTLTWFLDSILKKVNAELLKKT